ncbi:SCAN domain-containing protein 3-like [Myzus persicae]|uniref:SCAN domain-containing protein 3-like n=1 Tax=Myzus persicae TaxID=13164 RepID=UPI000B93529F|nr:SCAN domain-containing protein 3-like [Myzus persicae]
MKCSEESTSRNFQEWWTFKYGMIFKNNKALCVLCSESVVCRTSSVKRHFETIHKTLLTKSADELKCFISRALSNKDAQSDKLIKFVKKSDNLVSASFDVAKSIAIRGKPFSDGDFIKMSWLDCADNLFQDFDNKDAIIQRIKDLSISRNTIKERILSMNSNIENQLIHDLNQSSFFSICIDESTDITSSARLSIISRFCINDEVREELIKLASIPAKTTGENICEVVVNVLEDIGLNLSKIISVTTDGAPCMIGKDRGFVNLFSKKIGHPLIGFHCIIHQEALCAKDGLLQYENILKLVTKIVNFINARALNKRQFSLLLEEFLKCPDTCNFDELDLHYFEWMNIDTFEFELIDLQSCNTWKQKFIDLRQLIEEIEINRLQANAVKNADNEILKVWNSLPNTFNTLKKVARSILSIFSSTYACESLFSIMNLIKTKQRNTLIDETSAACVSLKTTNYTPDIKIKSSVYRNPQHLPQTPVKSPDWGLIPRPGNTD